MGGLGGRLCKFDFPVLRGIIKIKNGCSIILGGCRLW